MLHLRGYFVVYLRPATAMNFYPRLRQVFAMSLLAFLLTGFMPPGTLALALDLEPPVFELPGEESGSSTLSIQDLNPGGSLANIRDVDAADPYDLVAILVDENTMENRVQSNSGLFSFLGAQKLSQKIETYAQDVQAALPYTKTMIITVAQNEDVADIQATLERLYFEGNPEDKDPTRLVGVVIVGQVPLPVVNKNGNRFVSLLPYTDFTEPAYLLDEATQDFTLNPEALQLQPELWHGLIVSPVDGAEGLELLGDYFDKNHSYHSGEASATEFSQEIFIGDLVTEQSTINPVSFGSYQRFLDLWEELVYFRYSNDMIEDIYLDLAVGMEAGDGLDNDQDGLYDEEGHNGRDDDGDGLVDEDLGDGFYGIDNDEDGQVDEDGGGRLNNNDADWVPSFAAKDKFADDFKDQYVDEDPLGDWNGDGCPGTCGDNSMYKVDSDGDGYPNWFELLHGSNPYKEKLPWARVSRFMNEFYGTSFDLNEDGDEEATEYLIEVFVPHMFIKVT
jgi:hypothetical protein